jgi:hypothetical protein
LIGETPSKRPDPVGKHQNDRGDAEECPGRFPDARFTAQARRRPSIESPIGMRLALRLSLGAILLRLDSFTETAASPG